jgi:hypothetical protein
VETRTFDTVSRRLSLLTVGGTVVAAAVLRPTTSDAKKKSCGKKQKKKCQQQRDLCTNQVALVCNNDPECIAEITPCCDNCFSGDFLVCVVAAMPPPM